MRLRDSNTKQTGIVEWQLKYVSEHASELSPGDLEWAIRMEEAYERRGFLTQAQADVLEGIYKKL